MSAAPRGELQNGESFRAQLASARSMRNEIASLDESIGVLGQRRATLERTFNEQVGTLLETAKVLGHSHQGVLDLLLDGRPRMAKMEHAHRSPKPPVLRTINGSSDILPLLHSYMQDRTR
jgi:hypothetical protein